MEYINPRSIIPCAVAALLGLLMACGQSGTTSNDGDDQKLRAVLPSAIRISTLPDPLRLRAFLRVNGERRLMTITGNTAEATIPSLPAGSTTVTIEFEYQSPQFGDISLATASRTTDLQPGANRVEFAEADYQLPDDDTDSYTNSDEISDGTNPLNRADPPKQWGTAGPIETDNAGDADRVQLAVNSGGGSALAVWQQSNGTVIDVWGNQFDPVTGWGTAVRLESDDGGDALNPAVAIDANGNGMAVWRQTNAQNQTRVWSSRFDAATGWEPAVQFKPTILGFATEPRVAMNESGTAMAVWAQNNPPQLGLNVWANRFDTAEGWGTPESIDSNTTDDARTPQVAIDANGNALAVWRQTTIDEQGNLGTEGNLRSNLYVADTGWSNPVLVQNIGGDAKTDFDVAMDNDGNGITVWVLAFNGFENIRANRFDAATGTWQGGRLIDAVSSSPQARRPDIAFDESGKALAIWQQNDGTRANIYANRFDPASGWGDATVIESMDTNPINASPRTLSFGGAGEAIAVWRQTDGTRYNVWANRFDPATGWGTAVLAENNNVGDVIRSPKIGMDRFGRAVAVWVQSVGTRNDLWSNRLQ